MKEWPVKEKIKLRLELGTHGVRRREMWIPLEVAGRQRVMVWAVRSLPTSRRPGGFGAPDFVLAGSWLCGCLRSESAGGETILLAVSFSPCLPLSSVSSLLLSLPPSISFYSSTSFMLYLSNNKHTIAAAAPVKTPVSRIAAPLFSSALQLLIPLFCGRRP